MPPRRFRLGLDEIHLVRRRDVSHARDRDRAKRPHEVPPDATSATLVVAAPDATSGPREHRFALQLGWLAPIATGKGLQARLANLGLYAGEIDGHEDSPATRRALAGFRGGPAPAPGQDAVVEPTSPQTRAVLKSAHGC